MSEIQKLTVVGVTCDKRGCPTEIRGEEMSYVVGSNHYMTVAESEGWTFWVGRSRRAYCSVHGPSTPTSMRQIHPQS